MSRTPPGTSSAAEHIDPSGRTQLRFSFANDDGEGDNDYAGFHSADDGDPDRHPRLFVVYLE